MKCWGEAPALPCPAWWLPSLSTEVEHQSWPWLESTEVHLQHSVRTCRTCRASLVMSHSFVGEGEDTGHLGLTAGIWQMFNRDSLTPDSAQYLVWWWWGTAQPAGQQTRRPARSVWDPSLPSSDWRCSLWGLREIIINKGNPPIGVQCPDKGLMWTNEIEVRSQTLAVSWEKQTDCERKRVHCDHCDSKSQLSSFSENFLFLI